MNIRGVVLERTGGPLTVSELELAPPGREEVLVRLARERRLPLRLQRDRRHLGDACARPSSVTRAQASSRRSARASRASPSATTSRSRGRPGAGRARSARATSPSCARRSWPAMGTGGLMDGTTRLSRDGEPIYHYSFLSTFADACVVPERSCVPIPEDVPFDVAALVGCAVSTGVGAVWRTAGVRAGDRVAIVGCGGVGLSALLAAVAVGAEPIVAVDAAPQKLDVARCARSDRRRRVAGERRGDRRGRARGLRRRRRLRDRGDRAGPRRWRLRSSRPATRGAAVLIGIPREDAMLSLPARHDPANGAACPRLDLRLDEARAGLPAHRSISTARAACRSTASSRTGCRSRRSSAGSS